METKFRRDLAQWLRADATLSAACNAVEEESPIAVTPPWIGIAASAAAEWGGKGATGREIRVAIELVDRSEDAQATAALVDALETRIATLPASQDGYRIVVTNFVRSRAERRPRGMRAVLVEYRFKILKENTP